MSIIFRSIAYSTENIMTKEEYKILLLDTRWVDVVRVQVLNRDKYTCRNCKATNCMLHVHHLYYIKDKSPWEYPLKALVTLCADCHSKAHEKRTIASFMKKPSSTRRVKKNKSKDTTRIQGVIEEYKKRCKKILQISPAPYFRSILSLLESGRIPSSAQAKIVNERYRDLITANNHN